MNFSPEQLSALTLIACSIITLAGVMYSTWKREKNIRDRVPDQNDRDKIETLKTAFELVGMDLEEQLEVKKKIIQFEKDNETLREMITNTHIKITQVLTVSMDGSKVSAEVISVEALRTIKQQPEPAIM